MAVLRRAPRPLAAAFLESTKRPDTISASLWLSRRHHSASARSPPSDKFAATATAAVANHMLFDDRVAPRVKAVPNFLRPRVLIYDGVCHLCHTGVKWLIKADKGKKIKFCCVQSKAAEPYMTICGLKRKDVLRRFLFVEGPGSYYQGAAAGLKVLSYLPPPYSALRSLMIIPAPLRDAVYDYVAKRRYDWFGKDDDCIVLKETELLERFIDWQELLKRSRPQQ